jgi:hypothetical protein
MATANLSAPDAARRHRDDAQQEHLGELHHALRRAAQREHLEDGGAIARGALCPRTW